MLLRINLSKAFQTLTYNNYQNIKLVIYKLKVSFNLTIVNILKMRDDVYTVLQAHGLAKFIVRKLNVAYFESKHKGKYHVH